MEGRDRIKMRQLRHFIKIDKYGEDNVELDNYLEEQHRKEKLAYN